MFLDSQQSQWHRSCKKKDDGFLGAPPLNYIKYYRHPQIMWDLAEMVYYILYFMKSS